MVENAVSDRRRGGIAKTGFLTIAKNPISSHNLGDEITKN